MRLARGVAQYLLAAARPMHTFTRRQKGSKPDRARPRPGVQKLPSDGRDGSNEIVPGELAAAFGRSKGQPAHAIATDLGCSACRGVLYVSELGRSGWLSFRCRVGHAFSADSLLFAKEEQLEESLWSTVEVLEELLQLYGVVMLREQIDADRSYRSGLERRLVLARRHLRALGAMIEGESPAPVPAKRRRHASK